MAKTLKKWLVTKPKTQQEKQFNIFIGLAVVAFTYFLVNPIMAKYADQFYHREPSPSPVVSSSPSIEPGSSPTASPTPSPAASTPTPKPRVSPKPVAPKQSPSPEVQSQPSPIVQQEESDPLVNCQTQPECGGGTQVIRESECKRMGCCPIAPDKYEITTEDQCRQKQEEYVNQNGNPW